MAEHWATPLITSNPAHNWIVGKYVEADKPNRNMQMWRLDDLKEAKGYIKNSPLNVLHRPDQVVGNFVGAEMMYPTSDREQPYVEAIAAFWSHYFPELFTSVERYHKEGSLFYSMECVGQTMTFIRPDGSQSQEYPYMGPFSESYGEDGASKHNIRQINKPLFLAGALIFPPTRPGWKDAKIEQVAEMVKAHEQEAEQVYEDLKNQSPHLDAKTWEAMMLEVMSKISGNIS